MVIITNRTDVVVEVANGGTFDEVRVRVSYTLGAAAQIEVLRTASPALTDALNLTGNGFAQSVHGNAGANRIDGGAGTDVLTGRGGADVFIFSTALAPGNVDRVTDYSVADDQIAVDSAVFADLTAGNLATSAFTSNLTGRAETAEQRLMYETDSGLLWFDADGNGTAFVRVKVADFAGGLEMSAAEILVI